MYVTQVDAFLHTRLPINSYHLYPLRLSCYVLALFHGTGSGPKAGEHEDLLHCTRVKLFSDGSLGAETAALREPYIGTDNRGVLIMSVEEMTDKVRLAHNEGFILETHAIGDRALATVLEAYERAGLHEEHRPIITHCQVRPLASPMNIVQISSKSD